MLAQTALAGFVIARADEELWALAIERLDGDGSTSGRAGSDVHDEQTRLRDQALARRELADHYLRLVGGPSPVDPLRSVELLRSVCLMTRLDRDHPDYAAAVADCPLDCDNPLW